MNPMQNKTPEQRKAIAKKSYATRRENQERIQLALAEEKGLRSQIRALRNELDLLQRMVIMHKAAAELTNFALLREEDIAKAAVPWDTQSGVYFLLDNNKVVYVGQSVNVYSRIGQHTDKAFDRYAFVPCAVEALDKLESLYIHFLQPKENGRHRNGAMNAPLSLEALIGIVSDPQA